MLSSTNAKRRFLPSCLHKTFDQIELGLEKVSNVLRVAELSKNKIDLPEAGPRSLLILNLKIVNFFRAPNSRNPITFVGMEQMLETCIKTLKVSTIFIKAHSSLSTIIFFDLAKIIFKC